MVDTEHSMGMVDNMVEVPIGNQQLILLEMERKESRNQILQTFCYMEYYDSSRHAPPL